MWIEQLSLENFGIHKSRQLTFGDGLQLVYGPNESGKTTLLAALRQTLFGMPHQSPFAFDGSPITRSRIRLADGRLVNLERKKTRGTGISGEFVETREPLTSEVWERCLTGATAGLFENLFAISLTELSAGEKSLRDAGLAESLFGIAMGGMARFRQLDDRLKERSEQLFNFSSNARKPTINALIREIQAAERDYEQSRLTSRDFSGLREEIDEHESLAQRIRQDCDELRLQDRRLERIESALPAWRQAEQLRTELQELSSVGKLPPIALGQLRDLARKLQEVSAELAVAQERFTAPLETAPLPAEELVSRDSEIRDLSDRVAEIRAAWNERTELLSTISDLEQRVSRELNSVQPGWTSEDLSRLSIGLTQRETAQQLREEHTRLQQQAEQRNERRTEWELERDRLQLELRELPDTVRLPGCRDLIERGHQYQRDCDRQQEVVRQRIQLEQQLASLGRQLSGQVGVCDGDLTAVSVPLAATVQFFIEKFDHWHRLLDTLRSRSRDARDRFEKAKSDLAIFDQEHEDCDRTSLLQIRQEREAAWELIAGQLQGQPDFDAILKCTSGRPDALIDLYREKVVAADLLADQLLANAEMLGRRQQLVTLLEKCELEVTDLASELQDAETQLANVDAEWRAHWPAAPFLARSPREMKEWLTQFETWTKLRDQRVQLSSEQSRQQTVIGEFESDLQRAFPELSTIRERLLAAQETERQLQHAEQSRPRLTQDLRNVLAKLEIVEREQFEHSLLQAQLATRKSSFLSGLGLPSDCEIGIAALVVTRLMEIQTLDQQRISKQARLHQLDSQLSPFIEQSRQLHETLGIHWRDPLVACEQILSWRSLLDQRRELELERTRMLADRASSEQLITRLREQHDIFTRQIDSIRQPWPELMGLPVDFLLTATEHAEKLRVELRQLDHQWQAHSDGDAAFAEHLRASSLDEIREERTRIQHTIKVRDEERTREMAAAESLRQKLHDLADETRQLELGQHVESLKARLLEAVDEWAPLTLARHLMEQARIRFEKNQQPQLLIDAGEIFQQLTLGEYVQLTRAFGQQTELLAIPRQGTAKPPSEMSTGTREQLYLAIRLAYLKQYAKRAEPLPLVMDDVLVNFDEDRARQTLRVLCDFSQDYQILFLTCHRKMVELAQSVKPELQPLELKPGSLERSLETEKKAEPSSETRRPPRGRSRKPDEPEQPVLFR